MKNILLGALSSAVLLAGCSKDQLPQASFDLFQVETVTATAGDGTATVSWTAQAEKPRPLDYYVSWTPDDAQIEGGDATVEAGQHALTVEGLTNGCTYTFAVQARYAGGLSMKVTAFATPKSTRIAAANFKAMAGDGRVFLSWTAPETTLDYSYRLVVSSASDDDRTLTYNTKMEMDGAVFRAYPYAAHQFRGHAHKPTVGVCLRGSGFAAHGVRQFILVAEAHACAVLHDALQQVAHQVSRPLGNHFPRLCLELV